MSWPIESASDSRTLALVDMRLAVVPHSEYAAAGRDPTRLEVSALLLSRGRSLDLALDEDLSPFQRAGVTH